MLVVEVDHVDAQPLEAGLARLRNVLWPAVDAVCLTLTPRLTELGHQHNMIAPPADGAA